MQSIERPLASAPFVMMALVADGTLNCGAHQDEAGRECSGAGQGKRLPGAGTAAASPTAAACPTLHLPTRTSSAANLSTAVKGASSGTLKTRKGSLGSLVSTTLNETLLVILQSPLRELLLLVAGAEGAQRVGTRSGVGQGTCSDAQRCI